MMDGMAEHARRDWMAVLARAEAVDIERLIGPQALPPYSRLRGPEVGLAMVRGRAGGSGAPFNLGEVTVTRCTVRDEAGRIGYAVVVGREQRRAELAAAMDAALQDPARHAALHRAVIAPLEAAQQAGRAAAAGKAAATRVAFFTMAAMRSWTLDRPGFADPAVDAQACFRAVLDATSRPGSLAAAGLGLSPPPPLGPAMAAVLLTLADGDTPLWLDPAAAAAWDWLAFHCGIPRAAAAGSAAFVCALAMPSLASLHPGTDLAPEGSATLVLQVAALGEGAPYRLSGPGLRIPATLRVAGLPGDFVAQWAANHARYPLGVDIVLCAGPMLCALPRSVCVEEG